MAFSETSKGRYLPYPELVEARVHGAYAPYQIVDSLERSTSEMSGAVDKVARKMWVPLEPEGRPIGRHELGHVRWSPLVPVPVSFDPRVLAAVEDSRVNLGLRARKVAVELGEVGDLHIAWLLANDAKHGDGFALFVRSVASIGTSVEARLCRQLARLRSAEAGLALEATLRVRAELERARIGTRGEVAPERTALELAEALARELRAFRLLDANWVSRSKLRMDCSSGHVEVPAAAKPTGRATAPKRDEPANIESGRMQIKRARLTRRLPNRGGLRGWRASTEGSVIHHTHRWSVDRAIFRKRAGRSRGTVLVDVSSSMSLSDADLERLVAQAGRGTRVAIYSGQGAEGELRIVADGGRRAEGSELARYGGGNVVDLPALRWLSRQPGPRLWVSDGRVTGINDQSAPRLRALCQAVSRQGSVRRVDDIEAAARLLGARRR